MLGGTAWTKDKNLVSYTDAEGLCETYNNGHLVDVNSYEEMMDLLVLLRFGMKSLTMYYTITGLQWL